MEEVELEFKRFSADKQEQVRQLVAYTTLMGLTGKDLVSIGGKLARIEQRKEREYRLNVVKGYQVKPIGKDKTTRGRFKLQLNGIWYYFRNEYSSFSITNTVNQKSTRHYLDRDDWGRIGYQLREQYQVLWELHNGSIPLP